MKIFSVNSKKTNEQCQNHTENTTKLKQIKSKTLEMKFKDEMAKKKKKN